MEEKITKYVTEKRAAIFLVFLAAFFAGNIAAACVMKYQGAEERQSGISGRTEMKDGNNADASENVGNKEAEAAAVSGSTMLRDAAEGNCGYENGNTPAILDALKKHQTPATFLVVGNFVKDNPELVQQMLAEHHTVGNHTEHHPDMSQMADLASFQKEIGGLESLFREATGQEISKYYRPPQGKYSEANLKMAQELGYKTFFWSMAYVDWYADNQPTKEEAFEKLLGRIHPGALVLLHNTSPTNAAILDELLTKWEEMGYSFGTLEELAASFV